MVKDNKDESNLMFRFDINKSNLDYVVRTAFEFQDVDYWRDLKIKLFDARFVINNHFFSVRDLTQEQLFMLTHDLYGALIDGDMEKRDKFMSTIGAMNWYGEGFTQKDLENGNGAEMWIRCVLDNKNQEKNVERRLEWDYDDIAENKIRKQDLANMRDINEISTEPEAPLRQQERTRRSERRQMDLLEDEIDPFQDVNEELDAEFRYRNMERLAADLESNAENGNNIFNRGRGLVGKRKKLLRDLEAFFKFRHF